MRAALSLILLSVFSSFFSAIDQDRIATLEEYRELFIHNVLQVESWQRTRLHDVVFDVEQIIRDDKGKEKARFIKKVYMKFLPDTTLFKEEYLEYYKEGKLQSRKEMEKEVKKRRERNKKSKARNISSRLLEPFTEEYRDKYEIEFEISSGSFRKGSECQHFTVKSKIEEPEYINGDYYFDVRTFRPVYISFSPAKLLKKTGFKLNELKISISYGFINSNYWLPRKTDVQGKGKAAFLFGVSFFSTEYYNNPIVNSDLDDKIFKGVDNE